MAINVTTVETLRIFDNPPPATTTPRPGAFFNVAYEKRSFIQKAIRFVTKCDYTHSGLVGEATDDGTFFIFEASFSEGFVKRKLDRYNGIATVEFSDLPNITDDERQDILTCARAYLGVPYSYAAIWAMLLAFIGFTPRWLFRKLASPENLICSEAVAKCYLTANISLIPGLDVSKTTPADLHRFLNGHDIRR